ncbi:MAG: hypothetical protein R3B06_12200 [Kofleriaceae bacterium]
MRSLRSLITPVLFTTLVACGGGGADDVSAVDAGPGEIDAPPAPADGFRIQSPDLTIEPGQEITYCYYTTIPTTQTLGIKRWSSTMTPGSHHLILFFGGNQPDGTIEANCGFGNGLPLPVWTYSAQTPTNEALMPDGVGMTVPAGQKVFVQMHYLNTSDQPLQAHVVIDAEAYATGQQYTPAAAYITYNTQINIPPMSAGTAGGDCAVPAGAKFFTLSTHAHQRAVHTQVMDGAAMVFQSDDWEHPGATDWRAAPNFTFASGRLTYRCDYQNDSAFAVRTGDSAATDEMCMAVGYFFPATAPKYCINSQTF